MGSQDSHWQRLQHLKYHYLNMLKINKTVRDPTLKTLKIKSQSKSVEHTFSKGHPSQGGKINLDNLDSSPTKSFRYDSTVEEEEKTEGNVMS